ncbi:MAG TPA: ribose 5-phosphate isomerase B [Malonomonas sp.]
MIAVGSDHGGLELKQAICQMLLARGLACEDYGTDDSASVDYPDYGAKVAAAVAAAKVDAGILICGTGIGMSIIANKYPGVRAALVHDDFTAQMAKEHNNANILILGGRVLATAEALHLVEIWLDSQFEGGRHQSRLDKIASAERQLQKH